MKGSVCIRVGVLVLATALAVGPCASDAAAATAPSEVSAVSITSAHVDRAITSLDALTTSIMRRSGVPGVAIAVVRDGTIVYAKGFGVRKVGTHEMVDPNTVFQLASVSKSLASTIVAGAVGAGKVKWTDPIANYIPGFTLKDPWVGSHVTIEDMFAHRSGLPDHAGDILEDIGFGRMQIIHKLALEPLDPFRVTYHYTNFGLTAGAQAAANAEHTTWEALSQRVLYGPLGMTHTSSRWSDYNKAVDKATLNVKVGNIWKASSRLPDEQSPAGGASSSVTDLAKWMVLEMGGGKYRGTQIINKQALLETQLPQIMSQGPSSPIARASFYGLGMNVSYDEAGRLRLAHSGAFALGAATAFEMLPSAKLGIVILTNGTPSGVPEAIAKSFFDMVEFGKVERDWYAGYTGLFAQMLGDRGELIGKRRPAHPERALPDAEYAGTYANAYFGPATVVASSKGLSMVLGPAHKTYALEHWSGDTFAFNPGGENGTGLSAVKFAPAQRGHAATLWVELFDESGLGTFTKR